MLVCRKQGFESNEDNVWTSSRCPPRRSIPPASASENAARQLTRRPSSNAAISAPTDIPLGPDLFPAVVRSFVDSARPAADLAAARLSFKALRACADEQLPSLYHSVVTDGEQGPALSLRRFLCANSLAIGISAEHAKPYCDLPAMMYRKPKSLDDAAADGVNQVPQMERLHAFAQEKVRLEAQAAHDPALLLAPLQEQEQADLDRIESLTLSGNIRCFPTLCKLLVDVRSGSGEGGNSTGPSTGSGSGSGEQGPGPSTGSSSRACWKQLRRLDLGSIRTRREGADRINGLGFLSALPHLEEIIVGYDLLQGVQEIKVGSMARSCLACLNGLCQVLSLPKTTNTQQATVPANMLHTLHLLYVVFFLRHVVVSAVAAPELAMVIAARSVRQCGCFISCCRACGASTSTADQMLARTASETPSGCCPCWSTSACWTTGIFTSIHSSCHK